MRKSGLLLCSLVLSLLLVSVVPMWAEDTDTLKKLGDTFSRVAEEVNPSVVSITSVTTLQLRSRFDDPFFDDLRRFFGPDFFPQNPRGKEYKQRGLGSGVIVSKSGYILTNNHVVGNAEDIKVTLSDGRNFSAEVKGKDPKTDLAVIKIKAKDLPVAQLGDSDKLKVGEWVLAVGNPFGLQHTVTAGIVSATGRANLNIAQYEDFIQTDAAINPGNSGGPLVDLDGKVVGINTAIFSQSGGYMGVGFAIPINMARIVMEKLIEHGEVIRGWLGVVIQNVDQDIAESFGLKEAQGVLIADVTVGSPAEKAGVKRGDIILTYDGKKLEDTTHLQQLVAETEVEKKVALDIFRDKKKITLQVEIGEMSGETSQPEETQEEEFEQKVGIEVSELTPEIAKRFGYTEDQGVIVVKVSSGSPAGWAGLQPGDLILQVHDKITKNLREFSRAMQEAMKKEKIRLLVKSGQYTHYVILSLR